MSYFIEFPWKCDEKLKGWQNGALKGDGGGGGEPTRNNLFSKFMTKHQ